LRGDAATERAASCARKPATDAEHVRLPDPDLKVSFKMLADQGTQLSDLAARSQQALRRALAWGDRSADRAHRAGGAADRAAARGARRIEVKAAEALSANCSTYRALPFLPPAEEAARAEALLYEGRARDGSTDAHEVLNGFIDRTDRVLQLVEGFVPEAEWLSDEETLTYLHSCISTKRHRVRVPEVPMYLDAILVDEALIGGLEPRLGTGHLRTLTVMGFPSATHPGILDELNRLAFPYRWSTRAIALDKTDATSSQSLLLACICFDLVFCAIASSLCPHESEYKGPPTLVCVS
jgi:hypothetical protein